jgi:hypothetical protein
MSALDQSTHTMTLKISLAWWLKPYIYILAAIGALTGQEPNWDRVNYWIGKAVKVKSPRPAWYSTRNGFIGLVVGMAIPPTSYACAYLFARWMWP